MRRAPDHQDALYNIALVYQVDMERPAEAIPYWLRAIQAGIDDPNAYIYLANAHLLLGQKAQAVQWFRKALELYPDLPQGSQVRQMLGLN